MQNTHTITEAAQEITKLFAFCMSRLRTQCRQSTYYASELPEAWINRICNVAKFVKVLRFSVIYY